MRGRIHRAKPDRDNIDKSVLDALMQEDSGVACGLMIKRWDDGEGARLEIRAWEAGDEEEEEGVCAALEDGQGVYR